jgi:hypothetical protein
LQVWLLGSKEESLLKSDLGGRFRVLKSNSTYSELTDAEYSDLLEVEVWKIKG